MRWKEEEHAFGLFGTFSSYLALLPEDRVLIYPVFFTFFSDNFVSILGVFVFFLF